LTADEVTIVVLNWNHGDETVGCLESLARASLDGASILVVDNGKVAAEGTHDELLADPDSPYARMWEAFAVEAPTG